MLRKYAALPILLSLYIVLMSARGTEVQQASEPEHRAPQGALYDPSGYSKADLGRPATDGKSVIEAVGQEGAPQVQDTEFKRKVAAKLMDRKAKKQKPAVAHSKTSDGADQKTALLLAIFLGALGIHRFYLGYYGIGVVQLLTGGGCGIWVFIDQIRIVTGQLQPKDGYYETIL